MPKKKHIFTLTPEERSYLEKLVKTGKNSAFKVNHARILLLTDTTDVSSAWKDEDISQALNISVSTIERVRQKLVESGLEATLTRKQADRYQFRKLDGEAEAHLIALSCSEPPSGREHWTMKMLANKMVEPNYVESISSETVRKTLKKIGVGKLRYTTRVQCDFSGMRSLAKIVKLQWNVLNVNHITFIKMATREENRIISVLIVRDDF